MLYALDTYDFICYSYFSRAEKREERKTLKDSDFKMNQLEMETQDMYLGILGEDKV